MNFVKSSFSLIVNYLAEVREEKHRKEKGGQFYEPKTAGDFHLHDNIKLELVGRYVISIFLKFSRVF